MKKLILALLILTLGASNPVIKLRPIRKNVPVFQVTQGQAYLLSVAGTWCGVCRMNLEADQQLSLKGISYAVLLNGDAQTDSLTIEAYLAKNKVSIAWHVSDQRLATWLGVKLDKLAVPARILIDRDGKVRYAKIGAITDDPELQAAIASLAK